MVTFAPPTRQQLARIVNGDQELLRALEALFQQAGTTTPNEIVTVGDIGGSALVQASSAADAVAELSGEVAAVDLTAHAGMAQAFSALAALDDLVRVIGEVQALAETALARANAILDSDEETERAMIDAGSAMAQANSAISMF